ncbi:Fc.00g003240.m01.CDS01 [Cosmosporella sp. VM-42]
MGTLQAKRRNFFIAVAAVLLLTFMLYSSPPLDTDRFKHIIPTHSTEPTETTESVVAPDEKSSAIASEKIVTPTQAAPAEQEPETSQPPKKVNLNDEEAEEDEEELELKPEESPAEPSQDDEDSEDMEDSESKASKTKPSEDPEDDSKSIEDDEALDLEKKPQPSGGLDEKLELDEQPEPTESLALDVKPSASPKPSPVNAVKTSKFHYLVPGSKSNLQLCYNLLSSAVNRYPVPIMMGFNGTGNFDAAVTHLAKLRAINRYLDSLDPEEDDDLVMIVDGYDIIQQLPVEIVIERYFDIVEREDQRVAKRFGVNVAEARKLGLHTTVFFGPDKICWPIDYDQARCWAVPESNLPKKAFGPHEGNGEMRFNDPRWLNSGTVIGPINHMRDLLHGTLDEIRATYDKQYQFRESDQYYLSNLWGRQEYYRSKKALGGNQKVPGGGRNRVIPEIRREDQVTEFHVGIEYESSLFQTRAGYEQFFGWMSFGHAGLAAEMDKDMFKEGEKFKPYQIQMPANVVSALSKIYDAIPDAHPGSTSADWIRSVKLGTNFVTRHIFALWHCTGPKEFINSEWPRFWFYPYAKSLLKASVKAVKGDALITDQIIDGRKWANKFVYPDDSEELGGAWSDWESPQGSFLGWEQLCGKHHEILFRGEKEQPTEEELKNRPEDNR